MKTSYLIVALVGLFLCIWQVTSCGKDESCYRSNLTKRKDIRLTNAQKEYVLSNNSFAFNLLRQVSREADDRSFVISPLSVSYVLGMLNNGANGNTRAQIIEALGYKDGGSAAINEFSKYLMEESVKVDPSTIIEIANAVVANKRQMVLKQSFSSTVQNYYKAEIFNMDFVTSNIARQINNWCSRKTRGMIPKVVDTVDPETLAFIMNAIYFKGVWSEKFNAQQTRTENFKKEDGTVANLAMMHQKESFYVAQNDVYESVCLPYGNKAYRMIILLPIEGHSVKDIIDSLDSGRWMANLSAMERYTVDLKLPKFETSYDISLNRALQALGIEDAFIRGTADFSDMSHNDSFIDKVFQKAKIKVDEEGTVAAAVTVAVMLATSVAPERLYYFHADHPFLYAITEVSTGAIYFIGQYSGE